MNSFLEFHSWRDPEFFTVCGMSVDWTYEPLTLSFCSPPTHSPHVCSTIPGHHKSSYNMSEKIPCNCVTLYVRAYLEVFQVREESGFKLGCKKADLVSTVRVVLTVAGYSPRGQQATSSQPLFRSQEAGEIHHPCVSVLPTSTAAEGS